MPRAIFLFSLLFCTTALAVPEAKPLLKVGHGTLAPFVMTGGISPTGFDVDLWQQAANELGLAYKWVPVKNVSEGIEKVNSGELDVALGAISITQAREEVVDFTHPVYDTGLAIMVKPVTVNYWDAYRLDIILGFLLLIVFAGHLIWWFERGSLFDARYLTGVFEGIYWAIVTASTVGYGDKVAKGRAGQLVAILIIFLSLPLFGMFLGSITSAIQLQDQQSVIKSPADLKGRVGVVRGTTSADFVSQFGLKLHQTEDSSHLFAAFENGYVDAIVYDAPALKYYAQSHKNAVVLPSMFDPQHLGFVVPNGSPLREKLNHVFLRLRETKELDRIKVRWFGQL